LLGSGLAVGAGAATLLEPEDAEAVSGVKFFVGTMTGGAFDGWEFLVATKGTVFRASALDPEDQEDVKALNSLNFVGRLRASRTVANAFDGAHLDFRTSLGTLTARIRGTTCSGTFAIDGQNGTFTAIQFRGVSTTRLRPTNGNSQVALLIGGQRTVMTADVTSRSGTFTFRNVQSLTQEIFVSEGLTGKGCFAVAADGNAIGFIEDFERLGKQPGDAASVGALFLGCSCFVCLLFLGDEGRMEFKSRTPLVARGVGRTTGSTSAEGTIREGTVTGTRR